LSIEALAPTVAAAGIPVTWIVWFPGTLPPNGCVNVSDGGVATMVPEATISETGTVCDGTLGDELAI
jgi:hypothetical protein